MEEFDLQYTLGEKLGDGNFAEVKMCTCKTSGTKFAAKIIKKKSKTLFGNYDPHSRGMTSAEIEREVNILRSIDHQNIVKFHQLYQQSDKAILLLELVEGGELFTRVAEKEKLPEGETVIFISQILRGVEYLHSLGIVHLDLKPENIMIEDMDTLQVKIIDFGLARRLKTSDTLQDMAGTPEFCAPEIVNFEAITFATDMWAIGVMTYILLSGISPFAGDSQIETFQNILECTVSYTRTEFDDVSRTACDFIDRLLCKKPKSRATATECLCHPWIQGTPKRQITKIPIIKKIDLSCVNGNKVDAIPINKDSTDEEDTNELEFLRTTDKLATSSQWLSEKNETKFAKETSNSGSAKANSFTSKNRNHHDCHTDGKISANKEDSCFLEKTEKHVSTSANAKLKTADVKSVKTRNVISPPTSTVAQHKGHKDKLKNTDFVASDNGSKSRVIEGDNKDHAKSVHKMHSKNASKECSDSTRNGQKLHQNIVTHTSAASKNLSNAGFAKNEKNGDVSKASNHSLHHEVSVTREPNESSKLPSKNVHSTAHKITVSETSNDSAVNFKAKQVESKTVHKEIRIDGVDTIKQNVPNGKCNRDRSHHVHTDTSNGTVHPSRQQASKLLERASRWIEAKNQNVKRLPPFRPSAPSKLNSFHAARSAFLSNG